MNPNRYENLLQDYVERAQALPEKVARLAAAQQAVLQQLQHIASTLRSIATVA